MNVQDKSLWQRIEDNYNANTVSAKVGIAGTIVGLVTMVVAIVCEAKGYSLGSLWAWRVVLVGVITGIVGFTARPLINHYDGDPNT